MNTKDAQKAYDNMEHPDYYADDTEQPEEEEPEKKSEAWCKQIEDGKWKAEFWSRVLGEDDSIIYIEGEATGKDRNDALRSLNIEMKVMGYKAIVQATQAILKELDKDC